MKARLGVSPPQRCGSSPGHRTAGACADGQAAPGCPTRTPRPGGMRPRSRKGHRAPLAFLALSGTKGGSSPEARAPSRRPLKPRRPAGRRETTLVTGALGGRDRSGRRAGGCCAPALTPKDAAEPQRLRASTGSSALPGRAPSLPLRCLSGYRSLSRQSPYPSSAPRGPPHRPCFERARCPASVPLPAAGTFSAKPRTSQPASAFSQQKFSWRTAVW